MRRSTRKMSWRMWRKRSWPKSWISLLCLRLTTCLTKRFWYDVQRLWIEKCSIVLLNRVVLHRVQERIRFADERTKTMDWSIYDVFARGRKLNFMNNKAQQFRQWLGLGNVSRASLEFLNFVAYHKYVSPCSASMLLLNRFD